MFRLATLTAMVILFGGAGTALAEVARINLKNLPANTEVKVYIGNGKTYSTTVKSDASGNATAEFETRELPETGSAKWAAKAEFRDSKGSTVTKSSTRWTVKASIATVTVDCK